MNSIIRTWAHGSCSWNIPDRSGGWSFGVLESNKEGKPTLTIGQGHVEESTRAQMELKSIEMLLKYIFRHYGNKVYLVVFSYSRRGILWATKKWKCRANIEICDEIKRTILKIGKDNIVFRHVWGWSATNTFGKYVPCPHEDRERMELICESANRARMNLLGKLVTEEQQELVFLAATEQYQEDPEVQ